MICWRNAGMLGEKAAAATLAAFAAAFDSTWPFVESPLEVVGLIPEELWIGTVESFCCAERNDRFSVQWFSKNDWGVIGNAGTVDGDVIWVGGGDGEEGREPTELGLDALIRVGNGNKELFLKLFDAKLACCCCWRFLATTAAANWWLTVDALLKEFMKVSNAEKDFAL